ncbi:MAG: DEAD/DEAH box helicase, partial [Acidobacteriota bacterium]|nr:DEAD/DEAH box helicase [Acidobacteriota bacterium]
MKLSIKTPLINLHEFKIGNLSVAMSRKLALAVANNLNKTDLTDATVEDLLNYFPMRYEDRSNMMPIEELYDGLEASVELYVRVSGGFRVGKNRPKKAPPLFIFEITGSDIERTRKPVVVFWFVSGRNANHVVNYWKKKFDRGTRFIAYGQWEWDSRRNTFSLNVKKPDDELEILPNFEDAENFGLLKEIADKSDSFDEAVEKLKVKNSKQKISEEDDELSEDADTPELALVHVGRRVPVYRKLGEFRTKRLREIIFSILQNIDVSTIKETLPEDLCKRQNLISRSKAIEGIHFPPEDSNLTEYVAARSNAHKRLIFEEFFWVSFSLQLKRGERTKEPKGTVIEITDRTYERIKNLLPFTLTNAQDRVIKRIFSDMESDSPMNRLIQGDVGSGKTIVAFLAMYAAMESGYQAALMAPTEILAEQHARNAAKIFEGTPYKTDLLTGSLR